MYPLNLESAEVQNGILVPHSYILGRSSIVFVWRKSPGCVERARGRCKAMEWNRVGFALILLFEGQDRLRKCTGIAKLV